MRKLVILSVCALLISSLAEAQNLEKYEYAPSRLSVGVSPVGLITHFNVTLETPLSVINNPKFNRFNRFSVGTEFAYYYKFQGYHDTNLQPFARWYFTNAVGKGLYAQAKIFTGLEFKHFYVGGGADLGWKIPIAEHWSVDIYGGLKVTSLKNFYGYYDPEDGYYVPAEDEEDFTATAVHNGLMEYFGGPHDLIDFRVMICYKF